jgi:two-component system sensor histidine kinase CpxA
LLRDISHELRSPLTRLGIALELARKQANPESQEKAFARIELEAERMNSMIGQLLELTRLESGAERAEHHQVDLFALLDELVRDAGFEAQSRQCQVSFSVAGEVPLFCGSPELLRRAFENVIRNAVKYTAPGTRVEVKLKAGDGKIWIQILDRGPGVPEETLEKLFTPFYRVADARERESGGTGIGLAIADRSVRLHGGTIRAENRSRGGLKIEISLRATGSSKL